MLPGFIPFLGGKPLPTYGIDANTVSMMKFDDYNYGTVLNGKTLKDSAKPGRVWTAGASNGLVASSGLFAGGSCIYNDGTGYSGPSGDADYNFAGDFTIDFWVQPNGTTVTFNGAILGKPNAGNYSPWLFYQTTGGNVLFYSSSNGTSWDIANGVGVGAIAPGGFNHLAVQRQGSTWTTWCNGAQAASWSSALPLLATNDPVRLTYPAAPWGGYIDEIRFSKVARYSGSYLIPHSPYYGTLNGQNDDATKMLLHLDGSGTAYVDSAKGKNDGVRVPTPQGSPSQLSSGGKFSGCVACSTAADGVAIAATQDVEVGIYGSFTIDWWWFRISNTGGSVIQWRDSGAVYAPLVIGDVGSGVLQFYMSFGGGHWDVGPTTLGTVPLNAWTHLAFVCDRENNIVRFFINGVQTYSSAFSSVFGWGSTPLRINAGTDSGGASGYYDEVRFSNVARWNANFAPPATAYSPDLPDTYTKALLHFEGNYNDESMTPHAFTLIGGTANFYTPGGAVANGGYTWLNVGMYLTAPNSSDWDFGSGDFTIEWWDYFSTVGGGSAVIARDAVSSYVAFLLGYSAGTGRFLCYMSSGGTSWDVAAGVDCGPLNTAGPWVHRAVTRQGNTIRFFCQGSLVSTVISSLALLVSSNPLVIGRYVSSSTHAFSLDDLRISKGIARYTAAFTPPTYSFPPP